MASREQGKRGKKKVSSVNLNMIERMIESESWGIWMIGERESVGEHFGWVDDG